ncbi:MAG TPA: hypothetical protein VK866_11965 [Acidimicrobiales bacterium]|nr:hypothetical protein [Acidimicrobiales bacterium]
MVRTRFVHSRNEVELTFLLDRPDVARAEVLVDLLGWAAVPLRRYPRGQGPWRATVRVPAAAEVQFRYAVGPDQWVDDPDADEHRPNPFGSTNDVVRLPAA